MQALKSENLLIIHLYIQKKSYRSSLILNDIRVSINLKSQFFCAPL